MFDLKIRLVDEKEKYEKVKLVKPHLFLNRPDIRYEGQFELLEIDYKNKIQYVAFHLEITCCHLALYMVEIDKKIFNKIVDFIYKNFQVDQFYVLQSLNGYKCLNKIICNVLNLPSSWEEYESSFSAKTKYNRKREKQLLAKDYEYQIEHLTKNEITPELFEKFLELKRVDYTYAYHDRTADGMFTNEFCISDAFVLTINGNIEAIAFYSIIDLDEIYFFNVTYNKKFAKYGLGIMLFYHSIKYFIEKGTKKIYMGGGNYAYKENSKATKYNTYQGYFNYLPLWKKVFSVQSYVKEGREETYLYLLGFKFLLRNNLIKIDDYLEYFKKIKFDKKLEKLSKKYKNKKIIIYGAGKMSRVMFENYDLSKLNIVAVCDKSFENKQDNETFYNYPCITPEELKNYDCDKILISVLRYADIMKTLQYRYNLTNTEALI